MNLIILRNFQIGKFHTVDFYKVLLAFMNCVERILFIYINLHWMENMVMYLSVTGLSDEAVYCMALHCTVEFVYLCWHSESNRNI